MEDGGSRPSEQMEKVPDEEEKKMEGPKKIIQCPQCPKKFVNSLKLCFHTKRYHENIEGRKCNICLRIFSREFQLRDHLEAANCERHKKRKIFKSQHCFLCDKFFANKHFLTHFQTVHEGRRDFQCSQCPKAFGILPSLRAHMMTVHERRADHQCDKCSKLFTSNGNLQKHIRRMHELRKDFRCQVCQKPFADTSSMKIHVEMVHDKVKHVCQVCSKLYANKSFLRKHLKKVHGRFNGGDSQQCS